MTQKKRQHTKQGIRRLSLDDNLFEEIEDDECFHNENFWHLNLTTEYRIHPLFEGDLPVQHRAAAQVAVSIIAHPRKPGPAGLQSEIASGVKWTTLRLAGRVRHGTGDAVKPCPTFSTIRQ